MSMSLEFFSVDLDQVQGALGSGKRRLLVDVLKAKQPAVSENYDADDFEDGPTFEQAMRTWVLGPLPPGPALCDDWGDALALMSLVEYFGRPLGSLSHTDGAGADFRDTFLQHVAVQWLRPPFPMEFLLNRPLLGQIRDLPPFWGHLTRDELARLPRPLLQVPPTGHYLKYVDEWAGELGEMLDWAIEEGRDLVTFYG